MTCTSRFSIGMASSRSSALPWGMPSAASISTTSASSLAAVQCAAVAPTLPAPTMVTFLRMSLLSFLLLHVFDHSRCELAGLHLGGALHLALEVIGYVFLLDGLLQGRFDQLRGLVPAEKFEQHDAGEHDRAGIDNVLVGVLRRGAVGGLEDGVAVADVRARRDAETSDLRRCGVGDVVAVQVGRGQDAVV